MACAEHFRQKAPQHDGTPRARLLDVVEPHPEELLLAELHQLLPPLPPDDLAPHLVPQVDQRSEGPPIMLRPLRPVALRDLAISHNNVVKKHLTCFIRLRFYIKNRLRQEINALLLEPPLLGHGISVAKTLEGKTHDVGVVHGAEVPDRTNKFHEVELATQVMIENLEDLLGERRPLDVGPPA